MSYLVILIIILAVLGAFVFAQRISARENEKRQVEQKAKRILARSEEIWEIIETTSGYINSPDIFDGLLAYYSHLIRQRNLIVNHDDTNEYLSRVDVFKGKLNAIQIKTELDNDNEINQAKRAFSQASKLLRAAQKNRMIGGQAYISMRNTLRKRILDLEVDIHEKIGDRAGAKNDPAVAVNHYKFAKKLLIESDLKFEGKNQRVRNITHKTQVLFGNAVADQLTQGVDSEEDTHDEFGIPKKPDLAGDQKKNF
jgi:hypothetical protein